MAGSDRSRADAALLAALAGGRTVEAAAQQAGVSERTARRRLVDETFRQALAEARRQLLAAAIGRLADAATDAAETLRRNLTCGMPSVEVAAARAILDQARAGVELDDLAARVEALETMSETWEPPAPVHRWRA